MYRTAGRRPRASFFLASEILLRNSTVLYLHLLNFFGSLWKCFNFLLWPQFGQFFFLWYNYILYSSLISKMVMLSFPASAFFASGRFITAKNNSLGTHYRFRYPNIASSLRPNRKKAKDNLYSGMRTGPSFLPTASQHPFSYQ